MLADVQTRAHIPSYLYYLPTRPLRFATCLPAPELQHQTSLNSASPAPHCTVSSIVSKPKPDHEPKPHTLTPKTSNSLHTHALPFAAAAVETWTAGNHTTWFRELSAWHCPYSKGTGANQRPWLCSAAVTGSGCRVVCNVWVATSKTWETLRMQLGGLEERSLRSTQIFNCFGQAPNG